MCMLFCVFMLNSLKINSYYYLRIDLGNSKNIQEPNYYVSQQTYQNSDPFNFDLRWDKDTMLVSVGSHARAHTHTHTLTSTHAHAKGFCWWLVVFTTSTHTQRAHSPLCTCTHACGHLVRVCRYDVVFDTAEFVHAWM